MRCPRRTAHSAVAAVPQEIGERYPGWLAEHAAELSDEDLARYRAQQDYIQQICTLYEHDPDNYTRLVDLLQQVGGVGGRGGKRAGGGVGCGEGW